MLKIFFFILLYLYIFNPVFVWPGFGFVLILMAVSLLYFAIHKQTLYNYLAYYQTELYLSIIMILYVPFICIVNGTDGIQMGVELINWVISTVLVPIFLIEVFLKKLNCNFFDIILKVGFVASLITCLALFFPPFNVFLRSIQDAREFTEFAQEQFSFRYFGLANNLSNGYGYVQGILASLCLLRLDIKHKRYVLYFITMIISVVVNARTGLFPIFLTLILNLNLFS